MVMRKKYVSPIIVKRVVHVQYPHRRAEWKIAYADLVTALMAFFLLLWLLAVATPQQKEAIADYFKPSMGMGDNMGVGHLGGRKPGEVGPSDNDLTPVGLISGRVLQGDAPENWVNETGEKIDESEFAANVQKPMDFMDPTGDFRSLVEGINQALRQEPFKHHKLRVFLQDTPEGLKIEMLDSADNPLFIDGTAELTPSGQAQLKKMGQILAMSGNPLAIEGHMESFNSSMNEDYSIWELSTDRANATRRALTSGGALLASRITKVVGLADRKLLVPQNPSSLRNRRITIVLAHTYGSLPIPKEAEAPAKPKEAVTPRKQYNSPRLLTK